MSNVQLIPFKVEHLQQFNMRDDEARWYNNPDVVTNQFAALAANAVAGSLFVGDKLVAIIGWLPMWKGVVEVWSYPCTDIHHYGMIYLRTVRKQLDFIQRVIRPHRIQTHSQADPLHDRWMTWLGFKCEGTLKNYSCDKQDFRIWAVWAEQQH